ncbi:MAG TPA: glutathione ABC transporter permease GsiD, partial [Synergistaceae bacterium]|nr:glutathione ABC transporter permease GsiD [Synergistaceae bacterium]
MAGKPSSLRLIFGRIRRNPIAFLGLLIILGYVGMALFAPVLAPHDPIRQDLDKSFAPISAEHPLGCDEFGRDILSRILFGARISLTIQVFSVGIALFVGVFLGAISGFFGGWIDEGIMRIMDILLAFPGILLALAIVAMLGPDLHNLIIAIGIYSIPQFARITRGSVLTVKQNEYVTAARAIGETKPSVILRYVLPNAISPIIIQTTLRMAT